MERFLTRHKDRIIGTITGFDRMLFRGTLRCISHCQGLLHESPRNEIRKMTNAKMSNEEWEMTRAMLAKCSRILSAVSGVASRGCFAV